MKTYICNTCNKEFGQKSHFDAHKKRKFPCTPKVPKMTPIAPAKKEHKNKKSNEVLLPNFSSTQCEFCKREFKYKRNLNRHLASRCKIKTKINEEKQNIYVQLLDKMRILEQANKQILTENKKLRTKIREFETKNVSYTVNLQNNGNLTYNNNIKLVAYGKEDKQKFDHSDVINAVQGFSTELALTKLIHFNDKYPEYHNVYINNIKDKYAMIYDGEKWILKPKIDVVEDIYDTNRDFVEERMDDFIKSLDESRLNALKRWLETDENNAKIHKIKEAIKLLLYNEKGKVMKLVDFKPVEMIDNHDINICV